VTEGKAGFHNNEHTWHSGESEGKLEPETPAAQPPKCPECGSQRLFKDGLRYTALGPVQRYLCRDCYRKFSQNPYLNGSKSSERIERIHTLILKTTAPYSFNRQVSVSQTKAMINLDAAAMEKQTAAGTTPPNQPAPADVKGKIIDYLWWMEKKGYAPETIRSNGGALRALLTRGANLLDPESVKEVLAKEKRKAENGEKGWGDNRRRNVINAYHLFLKVNGMTWEKPRCQTTRKIPFIPTEQEIDDLIAGCPRTVSTFLQLLKETAMRSGEAKRLKWTDIDFERRTITLNEPEKRSLPRLWNKVSQKLLSMLNALPKTSQKVFGDRTMNSTKGTFIRARRRLAIKLQNPRLLQIHFHTLRHWKATMEYHKTKDFMHVKAFLGHKRSDNTDLYIQIEQKLFQDTDDDFTIKVAHNVEEAIELGETGFQPFDVIDGVHLYRKRK